MNLNDSKTKSMMGKLVQNLLLSLVVLLLSLLLVCVAAEITLRLYQHHKYGIGLLNDANHGLISKDSRLGWKMSPNVHYRVRLVDAMQNKYWIDVSTNEYGFRSFGDIRTKRKRILFVGDSFTAGVGSSDDKTYHAQCGEMLGDVEVFAYGGVGYGSLQECMIVDQYLELIRPDVIVWQFFENDFLDNEHELDIVKSFYNTGTPRPYLDPSGNIGYRYATHDQLYWNLPNWISENVRLLKILNTQISRIIHSRSKKGPVPEDIAQSRSTRDAFARSVTITRMIMERLKQRTGELPVYLFCITDKQPFFDAIKNICEAVDIHFIPDVPQGLIEQEGRHPRSTRAGDGEHLNETGELIVAQRIVQALKKDGVLR